MLFRSLQSQALIRVGIRSLLLPHLHFHFIVHLILISSFRENGPRGCKMATLGCQARSPAGLDHRPSAQEVPGGPWRTFFERFEPFLVPLFLFSFETFQFHYEGPMGPESGRDVGVVFVFSLPYIQVFIFWEQTA